MAKSSEKLKKVVKSWEKVGKSREKSKNSGKVGKVGKSGEKWRIV